jgi:hypothetical protein
VSVTLMSSFLGVCIGLEAIILHFILPASAHILHSDVKPRDVGRCGPDFGGLLCNPTAGDPCCSKYGYVYISYTRFRCF